MDAYFARQPIMDGNLALVGYELLFRPSLTGTEAGATVLIDGNRATSTVLDAVNWDDMDKITGGKLAFVNFTEDLLLQQTPAFYPNEYLVVEVLENIDFSEAVVDAIKTLKSKGYKIALDDYWYRPAD